jgi:hypothetical protein
MGWLVVAIGTPCGHSSIHERRASCAAGDTEKEAGHKDLSDREPGEPSGYSDHRHIFPMANESPMSEDGRSVNRTVPIKCSGNYSCRRSVQYCSAGRKE